MSAKIIDKGEALSIKQYCIKYGINYNSLCNKKNRRGKELIDILIEEGEPIKKIRLHYERIEE